ncbi:MAG TPA: NlpC/P60 family protein [Armatimonadota bacterium]|nr:NlpC/P60 family protein [Armatimonadota bacterium]
MTRMTPWKPTKAAHLIMLALKEVGKPYLLGAEGQPGEEMKAWDCSELVQHLIARVGVEEVTDSRGRATPIAQFDGAGNQWAASVSIPVQDGIKLPGALLFVQSPAAYPRKPHNIGHVAISLGNLGNGYLLEARGAQYGVTIGPVRSSFNRACKVRGLYTPALISP